MTHLSLITQINLQKYFPLYKVHFKHLIPLQSMLTISSLPIHLRKSFDNKRHSVIVVVGKPIDLESYTLRGYNSKSLTGALGWLNLITINEDFYLILVCSLYVAIDTSTSNEILFATIKGIIITLTPKIMS